MPELPIAVAMSGGVDSSTVAAMLVREGRTVVGMTMQLWNQRRLPELATETSTGRCCSLDDVYDARRVAEQIGIPYYVVNFEKQFEEHVVKPFVDEYLAGRTPIPCTLCNNYIKFDRFLEMADSVGAHYMATGHYARVRFDEASGRYQLLRAVDDSKDQTYFLFGLTQEQLSRTLFPLGEMQKPAVRQIAQDSGLYVAQKPDSQEICFIPGGDYSTFLKAYLDEQNEPMPDLSGELVTTTGEVIGHHEGIHSFTVGQRKGLGISSPNPLYVLAIHPDSHQVTVGADQDLLSRDLTANRLNWISIPGLSEGQEMRVTAKIRHRHTPAPATLIGAGSDQARTVFDEPQRAITPGQSVVFYQEDEVVGGGWIF